MVSLLSLLQTVYNLLQHEVSLIVFPMILKSAVGSGMILHLWHVNPNLVLRGIIDSQNNDVDSTPRILDICQELKVVLMYSMDDVSLVLPYLLVHSSKYVSHFLFQNMIQFCVGTQK